MTKKAICKGHTLAPCGTSDLYEVAMRNFRRLLLERVAQQEDEVFAARARFQLQRAGDREHFDRTQSRRIKSEGTRKTGLDSFVLNGMSAAGNMEKQNEAEQEFLADQQKLYVEHEEELQRAYPLAFLDDESAGVVAFNLMPILRGKFESLAREQKRCRKELENSTDKTKMLSDLTVPSVSQSDGCVLVNNVDNPQIICVKEENEPDADAGLEAGGEACVNILQTTTDRSTSSREAEDNRDAPLSREESVEDVNDGCVPVDASRGVVNPPWVSHIASGGEVEFVRVALMCRKQSRLARQEEKRRCLKSLLTPLTPCSLQQLAKEKLFLLKLEEEDGARKEAEIWRLWRATRDKINSKGSLSNADSDGKGVAAATGNGEKAEDRREEGTLPCSVEETGDDKTTNGKDWNEYYSPTRVIEEYRRIRINCLFSLGSQAASSGMRNSLFDFNTLRWETITLDDGATTIDGGNNSSNCLESMAESYLWPQHIEAKIKNVLFGEVVRSRRRWLSFLEPQGTATQEEESEEAEDDGSAGDGVPTRLNGTKGKRKMPKVLAFPRCGRKVWLKLDGLEEFVARDVRFYQGYLHP
ncbi:transcription factor IIA alpha-beta subunit [Trypanosoma cruzi]|nr:transcription factor IIA alpha-beta subunit [Trypanosoma cruzi]